MSGDCGAGDGRKERSMTDDELAAIEQRHAYGYEDQNEATEDLDGLLTEVRRLREGIRRAGECNTPIATGGTDQPTRVVGRCLMCSGCMVRHRLWSLLDVTEGDG